MYYSNASFTLKFDNGIKTILLISWKWLNFWTAMLVNVRHVVCLNYCCC